MATADTTAWAGTAAEGLKGRMEQPATDVHPLQVQDALPSLLPQYLDQIALSQSVAECSKTLNTALKDATLSVFDTTTLQEAGKKRILALRASK